MAIYHMSASIISRKTGRSATAAAAYRAGERIIDERTGEIHDYTKKSGLEHSAIITPEGMKTPDRASLWNAVEQKNKRADAQVAREITIALPHELTAKERKELAQGFAQKIADKYALGVDLTIHEPSKTGDEKNYHAHLLITTNKIDTVKDNEIVLGNKARELDMIASAKSEKDKPNEIEYLREEWAHACNKSLEKSGHNISIDHRTLKAQGIDREPTTHIGPAATQMERRGIESDRGEINRLIKAMQAVKKELAELERQQAPEPEKKPAAQEQRPQSQPKTLEEFKQWAREADLGIVGQFIKQLRHDSQKLDLQTEAKNSQEYQNQLAKVAKLDQEAKDAASRADEYAAYKQQQGLLDFAKKKEWAEREEQEREKSRKASTQLPQEKAKLAALEHALTRPEGELARKVNAHNERAEKAPVLLQELEPIHQQRIAQEKAQVRQIDPLEREKKASPDKGGPER